MRAQATFDKPSLQTSGPFRWIPIHERGYRRIEADFSQVEFRSKSFSVLSDTLVSRLQAHIAQLLGDWHGRLLPSTVARSRRE